MKNFFEGFLTFIGILCVWALLTGLPLWILWNLVMPKVFDLPNITFWQAVGIQIIASLLFKNNVDSKKYEN